MCKVLAFAAAVVAVIHEPEPRPQWGLYRPYREPSFFATVAWGPLAFALALVGLLLLLTIGAQSRAALALSATKLLRRLRTRLNPFLPIEEKLR